MPSGMEKKSEEEEWIEFSDMDQTSYNFLLSAFSLTTGFITHPLTVVAIRQQAGRAITGDTIPPGSGIAKNIAYTFRNVGIRGLFRGWVPLATMGMPSNVVYFNIIEITRERLQHQFRLAFPTMSPTMVDGLQAGCSSLVANFISLIPYVPAELISSRAIVQKKHESLGTIGVCKLIHSERGYSGFFRGFSASFYVNCIAGSQWWFAYSTCKRLGSHTDIGKQYPLLVDAFAGLVSGVSSIMMSHPFDTVKTRIMTMNPLQTPTMTSTEGRVSTAPLLSPLHPQQHSGIRLMSTATASSIPASSHAEIQHLNFFQLFRHIARTEGYRALYRGLPACMCQAAFGSTVFATSYEVIKSWASVSSPSSSSSTAAGGYDN